MTARSTYRMQFHGQFLPVRGSWNKHLGPALEQALETATSIPRSDMICDSEPGRAKWSPRGCTTYVVRLYSASVPFGYTSGWWLEARYPKLVELRDRKSVV